MRKAFPCHNVVVILMEMWLAHMKMMQILTGVMWRNVDVMLMDSCHGYCGSNAGSSQCSLFAQNTHKWQLISHECEVWCMVHCCHPVLYLIWCYIISYYGWSLMYGPLLLHVHLSGLSTDPRLMAGYIAHVLNNFNVLSRVCLNFLYNFFFFSFLRLCVCVCSSCICVYW